MKIWMEYLFDGQKKTYFCATLSVRVSILFVGVRESWSWVHDENLNKGHKQFDKAQHDNKQHMTKVLYLQNMSYGFGRKYKSPRNF